MSSLFAPLPLGDLMLRNRIALPPLTRCRSDQPGQRSWRDDGGLLSPARQRRLYDY